MIKEGGDKIKEEGEGEMKNKEELLMWIEKYDNQLTS